MKQIIYDFKLAWYALLAVVLPSFTFVMIDDRYAFVVTWFADSRETPWGIFTSIFVHYGFWYDFAPNAIAMVAFVVFFVLKNIGMTTKTRRSRSRFFLFATFLGAVFANALWIVLTTIRSFGASVAIYASGGVMFGFALVNLMPRGKKFQRMETKLLQHS